MTLPEWLRKRLLKRAHKIAASREPDFIIGGAEDPYLRRWWVIPRNRWFNIYLHHFCRSDDDRALHDHPWANASILLDGCYYEHLPGKTTDPVTWEQVEDYQRPVRELRKAGEIHIRWSGQESHRVELITGSLGKELPVWTIFITGPKRREWGFHCPRGWRHWRDFCDPNDKGRRGPGCD